MRVVQAAEDFAARAAYVYAEGILRGVRATLSAINRTQQDSGNVPQAKETAAPSADALSDEKRRVYVSSQNAHA